MAASVHDVVTLHNIDSEDFTFNYNASEGNPPYTIPAGEVARYPRFLAEHGLKHLIDKILTKKDIRTSNEAERLALAEQIVVSEEKLNRPPELTAEEKLRKEVEELNESTMLDKVLAKRQEEKDKPKEEVGKVLDMDKEPIKVEEKFEGLEETKAKEVEKVVKDAPKVISKPTRAELFSYAESQNLVLDEPDKENKTLRQRLTKMTIDEVIKELQYPLE